MKKRFKRLCCVMLVVAMISSMLSDVFVAYADTTITKVNQSIIRHYDSEGKSTGSKDYIYLSVINSLCEGKTTDGKFCVPATYDGNRVLFESLPNEDYTEGTITDLSFEEGVLVRNLIFDCGKNLKSIDLRGIDVCGLSALYDQQGVRGGWPKPSRLKIISDALESINLGGIDIESVTSIYIGGRRLKKIDFTDINTSNVTYMSLSGCKSIENIDLSNLDTSNITDMSRMFEGCVSLNSVDLSKNFNTSSVTNMSGMFAGCVSLNNIIGIEKFDTSNVTDISYMFSGCEGLKKLDLSGWDTSNVTYMSRMFNNCENLEELNLSGLDFSKCIFGITGSNSCYVFSDLSNLKRVDLSGANLSSVSHLIDIDNIITGTTLEEVDLSNTNLSGLKVAPQYWRDNNIRKVDLSGADLSGVDSFTYFNDCPELREVNLSNIKCSSNCFLRGYPLFGKCKNLERVDLSGLDMSGEMDNIIFADYDEEFGNLREIVTPAKINMDEKRRFCRKLPHTMYDEEGNGYDYLDDAPPNTVIRARIFDNDYSGEYTVSEPINGRGEAYVEIPVVNENGETPEEIEYSNGEKRETAYPNHGYFRFKTPTQDSTSDSPEQRDCTISFSIDDKDQEITLHYTVNPLNYSEDYSLECLSSAAVTEGAGFAVEFGPVEAGAFAGGKEGVGKSDETQINIGVMGARKNAQIANVRGNKIFVEGEAKAGAGLLSEEDQKNSWGAIIPKDKCPDFGVSLANASVGVNAYEKHGMGVSVSDVNNISDEEVDKLARYAGINALLANEGSEFVGGVIAAAMLLTDTRFNDNFVNEWGLGGNAGVGVLGFELAGMSYDLGEANISGTMSYKERINADGTAERGTRAVSQRGYSLGKFEYKDYGESLDKSKSIENEIMTKAVSNGGVLSYLETTAAIDTYGGASESWDDTRYMGVRTAADDLGFLDDPNDRTVDGGWRLVNNIPVPMSVAAAQGLMNAQLRDENMWKQRYSTKRSKSVSLPASIDLALEVGLEIGGQLTGCVDQVYYTSGREIAEKNDGQMIYCGSNSWDSVTEDTCAGRLVDAGVRKLSEKVKSVIKVVSNTLEKGAEYAGKIIVKIKEGVSGLAREWKIMIIGRKKSNEGSVDGGAMIETEITGDSDFDEVSDGEDGINGQAVTVGDPYMIGFCDPDGNPSDTLPEEAVITVYYTEEELAAAGSISENDIAIYRFDPDRQQYKKLDSVVNTEENYVEADIIQNGEYLLAVDMDVPVVTGLCVDSPYPTPFISAYVADSTGIGMAEMKIDDTVFVDASNFADHLAADMLCYQIGQDEALDTGNHTLYVRAADESGNMSDWVSYDFETVSRPELSGIKLSKEDVILAEGEDTCIIAIEEPFGAIMPDVTWGSDDEGVAGIKDGVIRANSAGETTVTAETPDGKKGTCKVTVTKADGSGDIIIPEAKTYIVTFKTGNGSDDRSVEVKEGEHVEKPEDPVYTGHAFKGWYRDSEYKTGFAFDKDSVDGDITLYAKWEKIQESGSDPSKPETGDKNVSGNEAPRLTAEKAAGDGKGAVTDTVGLRPAAGGKKNAFAVSPSGNAVLTLAKGNKIAIEVSGATGFASKDKSTVAVNKKGIIKAKKQTGEGGTVITYTADGKEYELTVIVKDPMLGNEKVSGNAVVKKLTISTAVGDSFDVKLGGTPINAVAGAAVDRKSSVEISVGEKALMHLGSDGIFHITGTGKAKGTVKIPFTVNGKKFTAKIKIK